MSLGGALDLAGVDGRVARAQTAFEREVAALGTPEGRDAARHRDPTGGVRDVTGQSTYQALRELERTDVTHRDALLRWVHELLQQRVAWELTIDEADAIHAVDPELSRRAARDAQVPIAKSFDEARRALVMAGTPAVAERAYGRLVDLAEPIAAVRKELRARRFEAARRLGLPHPWALATNKGTVELDALARAVLDATEPLARDLRSRLARRTEGGAIGAPHVIHDGFARDASEGWPARLNARWLEDVFRALAPRPPKVGALPPALGGASFLRASAGWGMALRLASVARSLPFALARDPYPTEAYVLGHALAAAVAGAPFGRRKLGLSARAADGHARALQRPLFFALRGLAAGLVAGIGESVRADEVEELSARLFGAALPASLATVWACGGFSGRTRIDLPARLVAAVRAHGLTRSMIDRFDEDWFDNPRAGTHLASIGAGPVWDGELPELSVVPRLARAFEEALG